MNLSNNKILITGGASGIGLGFTKRFYEEKNQLIVVGRRAEELQKLSDNYPGVITRVCDVTSEQERNALFAWINAEHPDLNVLLNNAGIQQWMQLSDPDFMERAQKEIDTNIIAPLHLTQLFIGLKSAKAVMNVSSGLSFCPLTKTPVYSATKAFFHSYTLSLRYLLKEKNIEVIEVIPPALNTDLGGKGLHEQAPPVADFILSIFDQLKEGKNELTFGFSELMRNAGPEEIKQAFARMNP